MIRLARGEKEMKRIIILGVLLIFCSTSCSFTYLTAKDKLCDRDFEIAGIRLGGVISKVTTILGKPDKIEKASDNSYFGEDYIYRDLLISSFKGTQEICLIIVNRKGLKTYRGIELGSSKKDVIARYGEADEHDNRLFYERPNNANYTDAINFLIEKGIITEIQIYYASTF